MPPATVKIPESDVVVILTTARVPDGGRRKLKLDHMCVMAFKQLQNVASVQLC